MSHPVRVAILWTRLSGYFTASIEALRAEGAEVVVFHEAGNAEAPFDAGAADGLTSYEWSTTPDAELLRRVLDEFRPDLMIVSSWNVGAYRREARRWRGRALRCMGMDNQWWGTAKQWLGVAASRVVVRPSYDVVLVAGERQAAFARRLGYTAEQTLWGLYTGDYHRFAAVAVSRGNALPPEAFLYVGRLVPDKGIPVLAEGYRRYRELTEDPWPLLVAGTGPLAPLLEDIKGVESLGFVQPGDLPGVMARSGCLVLPSRFEPWAVVVHEAAAAGLPIVCTWVTGASTRLVLDGYNGAVISPGRPDALAGALVRMAHAPAAERKAMSEGSRALAPAFTPERWAHNILSRLPQLRADAGF